MSWFRRRRRHGTDHLPMAHDSPPAAGVLPDAALADVMRNLSGDYAVKLKGLGDELRGKTVADSTAGHSGYLLRFTDGTWVAAWLDGQAGRMQFTTGAGEPAPDIKARLADPALPDASAPLQQDRPYAQERNDIAAEARSTHSKTVTGVSIGERAFSLCFPEGMELEGTVFEDQAGKLLMRIFWEQW